MNLSNARLAAIAAFFAAAFISTLPAGCSSTSKEAKNGGSDFDADADEQIDLADPDDSAKPDFYRPIFNAAVGKKTVAEYLGVSSHMRQGAGDDAERNFEFETYKGFGQFLVREDYHWHNIEPLKGEFHFETVETQVALAKQNGVKITAMLAYEVGWAAPDGTSSINPDDYANYAGKTAEHFCADIKTYEIWNEPDLPNFWHPAPDPEHYGKMLVAAYGKIKAACPDALVLFGGQSSFSHETGERWWFMNEVAKTVPNLCDYFDILALHPYAAAQRPSPESDFQLTEKIAFQSQSAMTKIAKDNLAALGCGDKPIWFTEMGWPSYEISEKVVGEYLARSVLLAIRDGVDAYFWYTFWDGEPITAGTRPHENYFGLFGWPGAENPRRAKPAFDALKGLSKAIGLQKYAKDVSAELNLPNDVYALAFKGYNPTSIVLALWDGRDCPDETLEGVGEGGPGTTYKLTLPAPEFSYYSYLYDINGKLLKDAEPEPKVGAIEIELTTSVQYLALRKFDME